MFLISKHRFFNIYPFVFPDPYDTDYLPTYKPKKSKEIKKTDGFIPQVAKGHIIPDKKRRKRRPKGYQWGVKANNGQSAAKVKRTIQPPLVAKNLRNKDDRLPNPEEKPARHTPLNDTKDKNIFSSLTDAVSTSTDKPLAVDVPSTSTNDTRSTLFDALSDNKRVLVASVTVNPAKRPYTKPSKIPSTRKSLDDLSELPRKKSIFTSEILPKRRRRSAIAGENFVASCLLSSRNSRKLTVGEKKRLSVPSRPLSLTENLQRVSKDDSELDQSFLDAQDQTNAQVKPLSKNDSQCAFAQPWLTSLAPGSPKLSSLSSTPFKLASHNHPTFKMMSAAHSHKKMKNVMPPKLDGASLTAYRDTQYNDDVDEENDVTSSSESESSSCSSAESSCDLSSDDADEETLSSGGLLGHHQWRERGGKKMLKKKRLESRKETLKSTIEAEEQKPSFKLQKPSSHLPNNFKSTSLSPSSIPNASTPVKRKRGRPRKHPLKIEEANHEVVTEAAKSTENDDLDRSMALSSQEKDIEMLQAYMPPASPISITPHSPRSPAVGQSLPATPGSPYSHDSACSVNDTLENAERFENMDPVQDNESTVAADDLDIAKSPVASSPAVAIDSSSDELPEYEDRGSLSSVKDPVDIRSKHDPTLPKWHSETSSLVNSPKAQGDAEYDSRQSSSLYDGVPLDDSFSNVFPSVAAVVPSSQFAESFPSERYSAKEEAPEPPNSSDEENFKASVSVSSIGPVLLYCCYCAIYLLQALC